MGRNANRKQTFEDATTTIAEMVKEIDSKKDMISKIESMKSYKKVKIDSPQQPDEGVTENREDAEGLISDAMSASEGMTEHPTEQALSEHPPEEALSEDVLTDQPLPLEESLSWQPPEDGQIEKGMSDEPPLSDAMSDEQPLSDAMSDSSQTELTDSPQPPEEGMSDSSQTGSPSEVNGAKNKESIAAKKKEILGSKKNKERNIEKRKVEKMQKKKKKKKGEDEW